MRNEELVENLKRSFGLEKLNSIPDSDSEYLLKIQKMLAKRIEFLINTNMDKLLQNLYQIDVPDSESSAAFDLGEIKQVSLKLAELIIRRQLQKIDYARKFYKGNQ